MNPKVRPFVVALVFLAGQSLHTAAQPPNLPAQPVPVVPQQPPGAAVLPPITLPRSDLPPNNNPIAPPTPMFVEGDPFRPPPPPPPSGCPASGFYGLLEIAVLFPELRGFLSGPVTVNGFSVPVTLDSATLDATGSPRIEIGYRLAGGLGAVALSYRSIVSTGSDNLGPFDGLGPAFLHSRLDANVFDLDYASAAFAVAPFWDFAFRVGVRGAGVFFDHTLTANMFQEHASNNFLGAGPHASIELGRALDLCPGLALTTKLDGGVLIGELTQSFSGTVDLGGGEVLGAASRFHSTQAVPTFTFNIGLSYSPPGYERWARFGFGYQFEYWWDVGTRGDSRGDLSINGLYFRGEFNF